MSDGETRGEELAKGAARASGPEPRVKAKGFSVDLGVPVGAANAHLGDPCLYCETPAALVKPGPCPGAGDHGRAIVSLQRALDVNVRATRIALEKATVAIGTACHDEVKATLTETRRDLAETILDVQALKRMHETPHAAPGREPGPFLGHKARQQVEAQAPDYRAAVEAVKLNLGEKIERLQAEVEMAHRNRQAAQDEADRLRRFEVEREQAIREREPRERNLAEQVDRLADFIMAEVPGEPSANEGAVDTAIRLLKAAAVVKRERDEVGKAAEAMTLSLFRLSAEKEKRGEFVAQRFEAHELLKDRLLKALAERDEARCEASEARDRVAELETQFAEEQEANDAEEADAKAARAALEAAQADFAKLADVVARFEPMPTGRGLPEVIAAIERMGPARDRFERDRKLLKDDANLVPHLKSTLEEALKQRADLEARLVAAEGKAATGGDADAAARLVTDLTTALGERDAARAALADRDTRRGGPLPIGWTAAVLSDTARLVRAIEGARTNDGASRTTYGRAADVVERLKLDAEQARALAAKLQRENAHLGTQVAQAESRARDATIEVQVHRGGLRAIAEERARQMKVEGFDATHDDKHTADEMAWAAACYAAPDKVLRPTYGRGPGPEAVDAWPWTPEWDKRPTLSGNAFEDHGVRTRALAKAGALIAAELDRLDRALPF